MRHAFLLSLTPFLIIACAGRTYETDRRDSRYQSGQMAAPVNVSPERGAGADTAVWGAAISGAMLAANPGYYDGSLLKGKLICGPEKTPALQIACPGVDVALKDGQGKELGRTRAENGEFAFKVQSKVSYKLEVLTDKYVPISTPKASYQQGDAVVIRLRKK